MREIWQNRSGLDPEVLHEKSKFTDEQIAFAPHHAGLGTPVAEVCRNTGVLDAIHCRWKHGGLRPSEPRKMRQLGEEPEAQRLVADLSLDKAMLLGGGWDA
jgi:putative transposase